MSAIPRTRYAKSGDLSVAYQVVGEGPFDLVCAAGWVSNVEMAWEQPLHAAFFERLASFSRLILFDKRGTGLSDRVPPHDLPTLEQRIDDVRAVMDAAGSERAALLGISEGASLCMLFAATLPQRTRALVIFGGFAKRVRSADYPWAPSAAEREAWLTSLERGWGLPEYADAGTIAPSVANDPRYREWMATMQRRSATPAAAVALGRMNTHIDIREVLPSIRVPTLVMHRTGDRDAKVEEGRYIASRIPEAKFVELPGEDHIPYVGDQQAVLDEIEEFLTGVRPPPDADRFLATVLFTDIVSGTDKAAELGDRRWRALVEGHHAIVRAELRRFHGNEVDTAGDGFFATFDGPARTVRCGLAVRDAVRDLGIEIRAGVHTGECERIAAKIGGIAVIIGARVREQARPSEVLVSSTVRDLVSGSRIVSDRGAHALKGVPGEWRLFAAS